MNRDNIIKNAEQYVRAILENESSGHDWYHIDRVRKLARKIARKENGDLFICELTALLHDLADDKLFADEEAALQSIVEWLVDQEVSEQVRNHVISIITSMSYKGGSNRELPSVEGKIVQDADRLDAIGAIGIGRTFAYSGAKGQLMHDPKIAVRGAMSKEEYRSGKSTAINHFYEKLLKLKDLMNTKTGKEIAVQRHEFLERFLDQFLAEWEVE